MPLVVTVSLKLALSHWQGPRKVRVEPFWEAIEDLRFLWHTKPHKSQCLHQLSFKRKKVPDASIYKPLKGEEPMDLRRKYSAVSAS